MSEEFGSGWALDGQFDLQVDTASGDVDYSEGEDELVKDISLNLATALDGAVGSVMNDGQQADVELLVERIVVSHPGVNSATATASFINRDDELEIDMTIQTDSGTIENVIRI